MGKTVQTNLRLDSEIRDRAIAAAEGQRLQLARFVELALLAYLDGVADGSATVARNSGMVAADIVARLEAVEERLGELSAA
ncbi:MAG: hypothetical protein RLZZ597_3329 [Cyanobacteriota bacterium]|jgi:hypothetical protein